MNIGVFGRILKLTVFDDDGNGLEITGNKIAFSVEKTRVSYPNSCKVTVYNLSQQTRHQIKKEFALFRLEGGYEGVQGVLFVGNIRTVTHKREGVNILTEITGGDGDEAFQGAMVNDTIPAGETGAKSLVEKLTGAMTGITPGTVLGLDDKPANKRAVVINGNAKDELDKLARRNDFSWSIQNGALDVVPNDGFINSVTTVSKFNGMIGNPEITEKGMNLKMLLNHAVEPNHLVEVVVEDLSGDTDNGGGVYRVNKVSHSGDNRGGDFVTTVEGVPVDQAAGKVQRAGISAGAGGPG